MPNAYVRTRPFSDALITRAVSRMTAVVPVMSPLGPAGSTSSSSTVPSSRPGSTNRSS